MVFEREKRTETRQGDSSQFLGSSRAALVSLSLLPSPRRPDRPFQEGSVRYRFGQEHVLLQSSFPCCHHALLVSQAGAAALDGAVATYGTCKADFIRRTRHIYKSN